MPDTKHATADWQAVRDQNAKTLLKKQIDVIRNGTHMADAPLPLHKAIYTSEAVSYTHLTLPTIYSV